MNLVSPHLVSFTNQETHCRTRLLIIQYVSKEKMIIILHQLIKKKCELSKLFIFIKHNLINCKGWLYKFLFKISIINKHTRGTINAMTPNWVSGSSRFSVSVQKRSVLQTAKTLSRTFKLLGLWQSTQTLSELPLPAASHWESLVLLLGHIYFPI